MHGIIAGAAGILVPIPSYSNPGGQGDRTALITVTTSGWSGTVTASNAVDGGFAANTTDGINPTGIANNATMTFDFGAPKYISEVTTYWNNLDASYITHWEGSSDNINWFSVSSSLAYTANTMVFPLTPPFAGYRYYRWFKETGTLPAGYFLEAEFKIAPGI